MTTWKCTVCKILLITFECPEIDFMSTMVAYRGHDYPENLPIGSLPLVPMVAEETVHYPLLGLQSDAEWFSLTPSKFGYVQLGPENRLFSVSMFHQLHCLRMLNLAFGKARIATSGHVQHCLNYLRQAALCSADLTIEAGNFEDRDFATARTGATYMCKDWSLVYPFLEENGARWKTDESERV
ncbi:hypothetical protein H2248_009982 [Termitomyces sp. 'cryptogamus']|nr:hypothetical protein H2248_009982 [Termitomyces sp. 'cryptogamus']